MLNEAAGDWNQSPAAFLKKETAPFGGRGPLMHGRPGGGLSGEKDSILAAVYMGHREK